MLSPLLYSLFTHDCMARHNSNTIIKFADDTTVVGLITDNDETAYREEVRDLAGWCQNNNLQCLAVGGRAVSIPGSDAISQDALDGAAVDSFGDPRTNAKS